MAHLFLANQVAGLLKQGGFEFQSGVSDCFWERLQRPILRDWAFHGKDIADCLQTFVEA